MEMRRMPPPFATTKPVVGMIHVAALPGTPHYTGSVKEIVTLAREDARVLTSAGCDGLLIENMHDVPYLCGAVGPEIVATMTAAGLAVRQASPLPLGVQILGAANREALAVAHACDAHFVRVENFAYAHVADEGLMLTADAGPLLRYRRLISAERVCIFADVKKKHASHALTADVPVAEAARTTEFFGADAVIITGPATGQSAALEDVTAVRQAVTVPVCVGSGLTPENLPQFWPHADIFIVGSYLKCDGLWSNAIDQSRLQRFVDVARSLRETT
jgi:membrane complex biogenesis BtpA family protein